MGFIKNDDIRAFHTEEGVVCANCATNEEASNAKQDDVITENDIENADGTYFCDRCQEAL